MARKPASDIVAGAGYLTSIFSKLDKAVEERGGSPEQLHHLATEAGDSMIGQLADIIVGRHVSKGIVITRLELVVDHGRSVADMLTAGNYNGYVNPDITAANFPHQRERTEEITLNLVKFDRVMTTRELEQVLPSFGDPADMDDMLSVGFQYPNQQRQYPIIFLGASWVRPDGGRRVGCLSGGAEFRDCDLDLAGPDDRWRPGCVFAVRAR